eukprot:CAMPEP_0185698426 /NCGR_PEP_ID=MMETSP1164-20130828/6324_1 /TAXON_ID=1104430 /ORGANISM="Chrysoreinhardia sp, Strain CCMP2950" /LENGTH=80 /DNA_ID=CAMNT_0028365341 /DNA_START=208 /DNA_END=447 /DNA_ORIENTATION=+
MLDLSKSQKGECATAFAALALYDGEAEITADTIKKLLTATGNTEVEPYWPVLFAKFLAGGKLDDLIFAVGGGGGGGGGGG